MARPLRIEYPGAWYHVMNRGRHKERIFLTDAEYRLFLHLLGRCHDLFELETHAYSLMPNHYHLLIHTPKANLSRALRHLNGVFTQEINRRRRTDGSLLRGRFKSILVDKDSYLLEATRYIHCNPYKAGLESTPGDHPWTSHRAYLNPGHAPSWLQRSVVLHEFGGSGKEAIGKFHRFVVERQKDHYGKKVEAPRLPAYVGTESFGRWIKQKFIEHKRTQPDYPQVRQALRETDAKTLGQIVSRQFGISPEELRLQRRGNRNVLRRAYIYVARERCQLPCKEIASELGGLSLPAVSKQHRLSVQEMKDKQGCYQVVLRILEELRTGHEQDQPTAKV